MPITEGYISGNEWTLFEDKVSWLATSSTPGRGNTILYAHNKKNLFGPLKKIKIGDLIIIEGQGKIYEYSVSEIRKVLPNEVDAILSPQNQLTLYTCDGSFDQKRLIVIASAKE